MYLCHVELLELLQFYRHSVTIFLSIVGFGSNQKKNLTHINLASFVWDIDKVCRKSLERSYNSLL